MTKEILRVHSPQSCEVYRLRGATLRHVASGALADLDTARVTECILGPDQFLWSQVKLDADGFTPDGDTFLFATTTIFPVDQISFLPPQYNDQTQHWTQIWLLREKLAQLFDMLPNVRVVRAELNAILPPQGVTHWSAGGTHIGCWDGSQITYQPTSSQTTASDQMPQERATLDGFRLNPRAPAFDRGRRGNRGLMFAGLLVGALSLAVPWLDIIAMQFAPPPPKPAQFDNRIDVERMLDAIAPIVSGMELHDITITAGSRTLTLGLEPDRSWPKDQVDALSQLCAARGCQIIGPTPANAPTITLRGMK